MIEKTFQPPYYAVIFSSVLKQKHQGYSEMARKIEDLAKDQPGYLGFESARDEIGLSISYWKDLQSIQQWKRHSEHLLAQKLGIEEWYSEYSVRICKVERDYNFKEH